jgi:hypothetical protein
MKRVALGVRMHSGWGVLVAVSGDADSVEIVERRRIVTVGGAPESVEESAQGTDATIRGPNQPYHYAATLALPAAEKYLANSAAASERLAFAAIGEMIRELEARQYRIAGSAVLLASGRILPPLAKILAAHPLIHTAEGEFFRNAVRKACECLSIPVTSIPERELDERAKTAFGKEASRVQRRIGSMGSSIGPPWTKDHKNAALAASILLASRVRRSS